MIILFFIILLMISRSFYFWKYPTHLFTNIQRI